MSTSRASARSRQLASLPAIHDGDSLSGAVGRLATLYRLGRPEILAALRWPVPPHGALAHLPRLDIEDLGSATSAIASSLGISSQRLDRMRLPDPAPPREAWIYRGASPVCPQCLLERPGAHQLLWRHALVPICLRHERTLVSHCPRCDRTPYSPDPLFPWPQSRPGEMHTVMCPCGATAQDLRTAQCPARSQEVKAARAVASLALYRRGSTSGVHIEQLRRAMIATLRSPRAEVVRLSRRGEEDVARYAARRNRGISPPAGSAAVTELLPRVLAALRDTAHAQAMASRPPEIPGSVAWGSSGRLLYSVRDQKWPELLPAVERAPSFEPRHLPTLLPLALIAPEVADLLADLHHAYRGGAHNLAPLSVSAMRRALSVLIAACLWRQSLAAVARQLDVAGRATPELAAIRDGAVRLDRCGELTAAIKDTAERVTAAPRIDYATRRATVPPPEAWLEAMGEQGIGSATATAWYLEHYACVDPGRHGWTTHECWLALTDHNLTGLADAAARAGLKTETP